MAFLKGLLTLQGDSFLTIEEANFYEGKIINPTYLISLLNVKTEKYFFL